MLVLDDEVVAVEGENLVGLDVPDEGVAVDGVAVVPGVAVAAPVGGVGEGALVGEGEGELVGPFADVGGLVIVAFDVRLVAFVEDGIPAAEYQLGVVGQGRGEGVIRLWGDGLLFSA